MKALHKQLNDTSVYDLVAGIDKDVEELKILHINNKSGNNLLTLKIKKGKSIIETEHGTLTETSKGYSYSFQSSLENEESGTESEEEEKKEENVNGYTGVEDLDPNSEPNQINEAIARSMDRENDVVPPRPNYPHDHLPNDR